MPEKVLHYKEPIAVIPKRSLLNGELYVWKRRLKRCRKQESIDECHRQIADVKRRLSELEREPSGESTP